MNFDPKLGEGYQFCFEIEGKSGGDLFNFVLKLGADKSFGLGLGPLFVFQKKWTNYGPERGQKGHAK